MNSLSAATKPLSAFTCSTGDAKCTGAPPQSDLKAVFRISKLPFNTPSQNIPS